LHGIELERVDRFQRDSTRGPGQPVDHRPVADELSAAAYAEHDLTAVRGDLHDLDVAAFEEEATVGPVPFREQRRASLVTPLDASREQLSTGTVIEGVQHRDGFGCAAARNHAVQSDGSAR